MKKLCRKGTVHPSPPIISDFLSFLPAAIFALTVALSADDKEVLAYLISCSNTTASFSNFSGARKAGRKLGGVDHAPLFDCDCFMCYRRYWARWDASPNRQLIHEIIDAYEDGLAKSKATSATIRSCKKDRRKKNSESAPGESNLGKGNLNEASDSMQQDSSLDTNGGGGERNGKAKEEEAEERGSVRRFVSFVGDKIWNAWG